MLTEEQRAHRMMSIGTYLPLVSIVCEFIFVALFSPILGLNDPHQDYGLYVLSVFVISIGVGIYLLYLFRGSFQKVEK